MQKKEKNEIKLSAGVRKMLESYCRAQGRNVEDFLKDAILEKIEFEDAEKDALILNRIDEDMEAGGLQAEEPGDEGFKRKH